MKKLTVALVLMFVILASPVYSSTIDVLVYYPGDPTVDPAYDPADTLNSIEGINATSTDSFSGITLSTLLEYDVFFAATSYEEMLDSSEGVIQAYLSTGCGVVVGQSNLAGAIDWLPAGLEVSVDDKWYPEGGSFNMTSSGQSHTIFEGISENELGVTPADVIYDYDLGPDWDVLMTHSTDPHLVGMAAGSYNGGRLLLWPTYLGYFSPYRSSSDAFIKQAFEWTAVPEPATMMLLGLGGLMLRRRKA